MNKRGLLIVGLYFDSWTMIVSLRWREWPNKGIDLVTGFRNVISWFLGRQKEGERRSMPVKAKL